MKRLLIILFGGAALLAQVGPPTPVLTGDPPGGVGGACAAGSPFYANLVTGVMASCVSNLWTALAAGGGAGTPGGAPGQLQYQVNGTTFGGFTPGGDVSFSRPNFTVVSIGGKTVTLSGNLTTTGAFNPTFAIPSSSTWTLPSGGGTLSTVTVTGTSVLKGNGGNAVAALASDVISLFGVCSGTQYLGADSACHNAGGGSGTVTSVNNSFTGGLISVSGGPVTGAGTLAFTVAGTSGGVPYFNSASTWASSAPLTANAPVIGGGAGSPPGVGTRSGNTTTFATTAGTLTSGHCPQWDASGNLVDSGSTNCGGGGSTNWNAITNPSGNLSLTMSANTTTYTYNAATGSGDLMKLTDATSNTGTGVMLHPTVASGSGVTPFQADANGVGFKVDTTGKLVSVGATTSAQLDLSGSSSGTVSLTVGAAAGTWTMTLPTTGGTNKYALTTDGSGVTTWSQIDLSAAVTGNLPVTNLSGGSGASSTTFWRGDGTWATPSALGTVTVVGGGSLTSAALVAGGGGTSLSTPSATSTIDSSGNMVLAGSLTAGGGSFLATGAHTTTPATPAATEDTLFFNSANSDHLSRVDSTGTVHDIEGAGSGTVTFTGSQTATALVTNSSSNVIQTPSATSTLDTSGNMVLAGTLTAGTGPFEVTGAHESAPGTPAATKSTLYFDATTDRLSRKDSSGNIIVVEANLKASATTSTPVSVTTTYPFQMFVNEHATAATAITYNLPTAAANLQYCFMNGNNGTAPNTGVLTIATSASGQFILFTDGTLSASGGNVASQGAGGEFACVVGLDSTHWVFRPGSGVWTKN